MATQDEVVAETKAVDADVSDLEKKIIRQIEYYFGDVNLPRDKFLKEKITEDDGWVTIECLTTFNRLKKLSTDLAEIANALKKSKTALLEVNDTDFKVRRAVDKPIPNPDDPEVRKASRERTLYIKGFPTTYTLDDIQDFFTVKQDVNTNFLKLKRDDEKQFKGSIFVEVSTQEEADKLLNDKDLKCEDSTLIVMKRDDYFTKKKAERGDQKDISVNTESEENKKLMKKSGAVLHFNGVGDGASREDLKALFGPHENIAWVDFSRGETEGFVRFQEEGAAQKAIDAVKAANEDKILIKDVESVVRVLEGEEAENYWKMVEEDKQKQRSRKPNQRGRGRGRGRGRNKQDSGEKHFKRKRRWEHDEDKHDDGEKEGEKLQDDVKREHKRFDEDTDAGEYKKDIKEDNDVKKADEPACKIAKVEE